VPLPLGCTSSVPAAEASTAAARRGGVVCATPAGASLVLVLPFLPAPFSLVPPPPPLLPVNITPLRRHPAKAPASAELAALGGILWPVRPSRAGKTAEPPSPPTCRLGVPDGAPARLLVLTGCGGASGGGEKPAGVRVVAARTCGEPDTADATRKPRARVIGGRKSTYTEAMLAAATVAVENADTEGFGRPEPDSRAHAVPVRAQRLARRATASPATVAAAATAAAPGAAPGTCGAAGPASSDAGVNRRRSMRLDTIRFVTASLGTAHSVNDGAEAGSGHEGGDGARGDGANDSGDGARGHGAHSDAVGGHRRRSHKPQGRARGSGFRAADWIPGWRILRTSDKFGGAAAAAAATSAPPPRGRGSTSESARVREYRGAGDGDGAEEEEGGEEDEPRERGSQGAWRAPK